MMIFLGIVMGPGLGFMLYALLRFWREATGFGHAGSRSHSGPVAIVTAINPADDENSFRAWDKPAAQSDAGSDSTVVNFHAAGDRRAQRKMLVTCLQNRVAVLRSERRHAAVR